MIARRAALVLVALLCAGVAGLGRVQLERHGEGRVPAGLLYLPKGPFLRALALGQEETLADLLYVWSIQYYSNYDDRTRYEYLGAVFDGAITELDPRDVEAYEIGSLIMSVEAQRHDLALKLLDKGIAKNPDDWELPYWAGWEAYMAREYERARRYWQLAERRPGAPVFIGRLALRMLEKEGNVDVALAEYRHVLETTSDEKTRRVVQGWIDRLETGRVLGLMRDALAHYRERHGHCPAGLDALVREHDLARVPDELGPLRYDAGRCEVLPPPGQSFGAR